MGRRLAFAAAALVCVVAVLLWLGRRERGELREARLDSQLFAFDDRRVTAFTLEEGGALTRFERTEGGWTITQPVPDPASAEAIDTVFGALRRATVVRAIADEGGLEQFGLNPPRHALRLEGGEFPEIDLGDVDPTGAGVFARVSGRPGVLLVRLPDAKPLAELTTAALRDRQLLGVPRSRVSAMAIARAGAEVRLARRPGGWWISSPREFPASDAAVERILEILAGSQSGRLDDPADPSDPKLGLSGSGATEIRLSVGSEVRRIVLGPVAADGSAWATRDDRVAAMPIPEAKFDRVPATFEQLRESRLTKVNRYTVTKLVWNAPEGGVTAVREGETTWKSPSGELLRGTAVTEFLASALDAQVAGWSEGNPSAGRAASLEVEAEGGVKERVEFFADGTARVASLPGVVYRLASPRPAFNP